MRKADYVEVDCKEIKHLFNGNLILLVTATDIETKYTHQKLSPLKDYDKIVRVFIGNQTYYFGIFGIYTVAHVQCAMGSISRDSSIMTVSTALTKLKAKVV